MTRLDRNKDYLDQIYYAVGNMYLSRGDTAKAVENYILANEKAHATESTKPSTKSRWEESISTASNTTKRNHATPKESRNCRKTTLTTPL